MQQIPQIPQGSPASSPAPTDMGAVNLAKAIRTVESNGNFNAQGKSGEFGAYQFMPKTWQAWAGQYLGDPNAQMTPENQNKVAYSKIVDLKSQGYTPEQVASIWNSGSPDFQGNVGVNKQGIAFNTPKYVDSIISKFQQLKQGVQNGPTLPNPSQVGDQTQPDQKSLGGFIGNIFGSAGNLIGGLANTVLHPIQTAENIGTAITHPSMIMDALKQRYGGLQQIEDTLYKDPIGVALDVSTVLGGVGLAGKLGAEGSTLADIGNLAGKASEATNPLALMGKGAGAIGTGVKNVAQEALGVSTGEGATFQKIIENASKEGGAKLDAVNTGMNLQPEDIMQKAQSAQQDLVNQAHSDYRTQLANIKGVKSSLDISPINNELTTQLDKFGIPNTVDESGNLDFSRSSIRFDKGAQADVQQIYDTMKGYGTSVGDRTPLAVDSLKKAFDDLYSKSSNVRAFVQAMKSSTRNVLNQVPGYSDMTSGYNKALTQLQDITDATGIGGRAKAETIMNKIMGSLNKGKENRINALNQLGGNLPEMIAGYKASKLAPGGLAKYLAGGEGIGLLMNPGAAIPLGGTILASSPKIAGTIAKATGLSERGAGLLVQGLQKVTGLKPAQIAQLLTQANRANPGGQ